MKPFIPMSPILVSEIPTGSEWGHQLKWDGYRIISDVDNGKVELFTKKMLPKNNKFPELVEALSKLKGSFILDGEAVIMDPETQKPNFQKMQNYNFGTRPAVDVQYIVFDLLEQDGEDLRNLPFSERHERLQKLAADWTEPLFTTDLFPDGEILWEWVKENGWEGVVSKKLDSKYVEGKNHTSWYKRKTELRMLVDIPGLIMKDRIVNSLVMQREGKYIGRNSLGLNGKIKTQLGILPAERTYKDYFAELPKDLRGETIRWLDNPIEAIVTGLEMTEAGTLRHPKILSLDL